MGASECRRDEEELLSRIEAENMNLSRLRAADISEGASEYCTAWTLCLSQRRATEALGARSSVNQHNTLLWHKDNSDFFLLPHLLASLNHTSSIMSTLEDLDDLEREQKEDKKDDGDKDKKQDKNGDAEMKDAEPEEKEEDPIDEEIYSLSTQDILTRKRLLENDSRIMKSEFQRLSHEKATMGEKIKDNLDKIENNR